MNLTEPIWRNSYATPDREAILFEGRAITYVGLRKIVGRFAARLHDGGVRRGDCVAVSVSNALGYVIAFLALARIGAVTTPLYRDSPEDRKLALLARNGASAVVQDANDTWRSPSLQLKYFNVQKLIDPVEEGTRLAAAPVAVDAGDEMCLIALSSGTTGVPKSIPITHSKFVLSLNLVGWNVADSRALVFTDMMISMGIMRVLRILSAGATVILVTSADPRAFFSEVERTKPHHVVTTSGLAMGLVRHAEQHRKPEPLPCIRTFSAMGAAVSPAVAEAIEKYICPQLEVGYGSTEAGGIARTTPETRAFKPGSSGRLYAFVEAQAVGDNGEVLAPGKVGLLRFRTPQTASGYLNDEAATQKYFRDGWFYPGDVGAIDPAGYLMLQGRSDSLMNLGGRKLNPEVIEAAIDSHPCVHESAVVGIGEDSIPTLVAAVVVKGPVSEAELLGHVRAKLGASQTPGRCIFLAQLPKNPGGKVVRRDLRALIEKQVQVASS